MTENCNLVTKEPVVKKKYEKPKHCYVQHCFNSSTRTPEKHFIYVRRGPARLAWLQAGRVHPGRSMKTNMYCCQDHFDLENDFETEYAEALRLKIPLKLKQGVIPHLNLNLRPTIYSNDPIIREEELDQRLMEAAVASISDTPVRYPEDFPMCDVQPQAQDSSTSKQQTPSTTTTTNKKSKKKTNNKSNINKSINKTDPSKTTQENTIKMWTLEQNLKQEFINRLDIYLETGIHLTPLYLKLSFKRFINKNYEELRHKLLLPNWFQQLLYEHKDISSKLITPTLIKQHSLNQLALVSHFSTLRFLYKHVFNGKSSCVHPEKIYAIDEYILRTPVNICPSEIEVFRKEILPELCVDAKIVTVLFCVNSFGYKIPPLVIFPSKGIRPALKKAFPQDWKIVAETNGKLTSYYFQFWVEHFVKLKQKGRTLLLLNDEMRKYLTNLGDDLLQILEEAEITIHFLQKSERDELNPLGYSVFRNFGCSLQQLIANMNEKNPMNKITPEIISHMVTYAWQIIDPATVAASFRSAGVFPLNPAAFLTDSDSENSSDQEGGTSKLCRTTQAKSYSSKRRKSNIENISVLYSNSTGSLLPEDSIITSVDISEHISDIHEIIAKENLQTQQQQQEQQQQMDQSNLWTQLQPSIDLDLSSIDTQTLELNFMTNNTDQLLSIPISQNYFETNNKEKYVLTYTELPTLELQQNNVLVPTLKLDVIPDSHIENVTQNE